MDPRWNANKAPELEPIREPGIASGHDMNNLVTETFKRLRGQESATVATPATAASPSTPVTSSGPAKPPAPVINRLHTESASVWGGYIFVGRDHDLSEVDQTPPMSPGYLYQAKASSIMDAYAKAQVMQKLIKFPANSAQGRVAIIILGSSWNEGPQPFNLVTPGIDFIGIGQPGIGAQVIINPSSDTNFYGCDFIPGGLAGPGSVWLLPYVDTNPVTPKNAFYNCRSYVPMTMQGRFYSQDCHWYATSAPMLGSELLSVPLSIQYTGQDLGPSIIRGGSINAFSIQQPLSDGVPMGYWPSGYALKVSCGACGPWSTFGDFGDPLYLWPNTHVELDHVLVNGSLYCDSARVQHTHCEVHGGMPLLSARGNVYADCYTRKFLNGDESFNGYIPAHVMFDDTVIRSFVIARALTNGDSVHPGMSLVQMTNSPHKTRWDHSAGAAFNASPGGNGTALIANSPTGAGTWSGGWITTTEGSCPISSVACKDFYSM